MEHLDDFNELLTRYFDSIWENNAAILADLLSDDAKAIYPDSGRNWSGKEDGISKLFTLVNFLKKQPDPHVTFGIVDIVQPDPDRDFYRLKLNEIFTYNGNTHSYPAFYEVTSNRISLFDYTKK
eukprot:TRINITY_DN4612_c0_g1_i1.p1 TRINITY_DN4612_c0_g1~~TRINITY_DN4612_c0_g1_i1.p1  ORF type:complete len:124 (-),score=20.94 TRINITY_DN4612_c0_g1_i1:112-483(-)